MKKLMINLVAIISLSVFATGLTYASPSSDCGDDDVQPINVHTSASSDTKDV